MCFLGLEVEAGLFTFFAIILQEFEELDHVVVDGVPGYRDEYLLIPAAISASKSRAIN